MSDAVDRAAAAQPQGRARLPLPMGRVTRVGEVLIALTVTSAATVLIELLESISSGAVPFLYMYVPAVALAAYAAGQTSGNLSTLFAAVGAVYVLTSAGNPWGVGAARLTGVAAFALVAFATSRAMSRLRSLYLSQVDVLEALDALNAVSTDVHRAVRVEEAMMAVAEAARRLAGGGETFAALFRGRGESSPTEYHQWEVAGASRTAFEHLQSLHITPLFTPTFQGRGTVRADDVRLHPLFGGLPSGHVPVASYLAVPVTSRAGTIFGAILLGHPQPGRFDDAVQRQIESLAKQAAVALENALLYERQRSTAETLQHSLLPERIPELPGITMAVRYLPGAEGGEVGGDWYDVFNLPNGKIGLVVGDVAGRGVEAAALMGQVRNVLRAYALEFESPATVATHVNGFLLQQGKLQMVTLCYLLLDPVSLEAKLTIAGHPPALALMPDGSASYLDLVVSPPLGVSARVSYEEASVRLARGTTVVLYTDGLVERRDVPIQDGLALVRSSSMEHADDVEDLVEHVLAALGRKTRVDDVVVVAFRLTVPVGSQANGRAVPAAKQ